MTDDVKNKLTERSELTKKYHKYGILKPDLDKVIARWNESVEAISAAKDKNVNPFLTNVPLLYLLKTSENWGSSDISRSYRGGTLVENGLKEMYGN